MKLRNKKTGEILHYTGNQMIDVWYDKDNEKLDKITYSSLAELIEEWEDYEEPKEYWFIDFNGEVKEFELLGFEWQGWMKEIGNYFETKEEAENAVRKLKAWKRLKDNGFRFETYGYDRETVKNGRVNIMIKATFDEKYGEGSIRLSHLDLLFGGEE